MTTTNIVIMIAIVMYLVGMVAIGIFYSNKNKKSDDFYLGGRKLGPLVTAMSAEASDMSGWLLSQVQFLQPQVLPASFWALLLQVLYMLSSL